MADEKKSSDLDDALDAVAKLASGLAGKAFKAPNADEQPVVNEEFDKAVDDVGATLGGLLSAAGEAMREHSRAPEKAVDATVEKVKHGHEAEASENWSPLVEGASTFMDGFGKMTTDILDSLASKDTRSDSDSDSDSGEE